MVVCGMIRIFLSPSGGLVNLMFGTNIDFLTEASAFRTIYSGASADGDPEPEHERRLADERRI